MRYAAGNDTRSIDRSYEAKSGKRSAEGPTVGLGAVRPVLAWLSVALLGALVTSHGSVSAAEEVATLPPVVFAIVDGETIETDEFTAFVNEYARQKYYHGAAKKDPSVLRSEAGEELIKLRLLAREARRRGFPGDPEKVERELASLEARLGDRSLEPSFQQELPRIRERLLDNTKVAMLRDAIRQVEEPDEQVLLSFYEDNIALFTEPARARISLILVGVPPWETTETWEAVRGQVERLAVELSEGADFAQLARQHSTHDSAAAGGDLGLVHDGTFSATIQQELAKLAPGETTAPIRVLEGYALFRVLERLPSRVRAFDEVRDRAGALYKRDRAERQWTAFVSDLRQRAQVTVNETVLLADQE